MSISRVCRLIDSGLVSSTDLSIAGPAWEGCRERRRCSRETHPESHTTKHTSVRGCELYFVRTVFLFYSRMSKHHTSNPNPQTRKQEWSEHGCIPGAAGWLRPDRCVPPLILHPTAYTQHPTPYTLHPTPYTLHPSPYTPHPTPYTQHPTPFILHPTPYTLHPTLLNPKP